MHLQCIQTSISAAQSAWHNNDDRSLHYRCTRLKYCLFASSDLNNVYSWWLMHIYQWWLLTGYNTIYTPLLVPVVRPLGLVGLDATDVVGWALHKLFHQKIRLVLRCKMWDVITERIIRVIAILTWNNDSRHSKKEKKIVNTAIDVTQSYLLLNNKWLLNFNKRIIILCPRWAAAYQDVTVGTYGV
jgi:hypothetical protein